MSAQLGSSAHPGDRAEAQRLQTLDEADGQTPVSRKPDRKRPLALVTLLAISFGAVYFLAARVGLALLAQPEGIAVFWPASGFAAGALVLLGPRQRVPLAMGVAGATVAANLMGDRNTALAVVFSLCNAGEALLVGAILERRFGRQFEFANLKSLVWFFISAAASTALMALAAAVAIQFFTGAPTPILNLWQTWWLSDAIGIIMFAPLLITLRRRDAPKTAEDYFEGVAVLAVLVAVTTTLYFAPPSWAEIWAPSPVSVIFPVLLWLAARCRPVFVTAGIFLVALLIVWSLTEGTGRLNDPVVTMLDRAYAARTAMVSLAFCALAFMSVFTERRRGQEILAQTNQSLEQRVRERTQQLEHEMRLKDEARAALAQSQRMDALGQLTGGIAHDLNNLLTAVSGNLELAEERIENAQARQSVRQAIDAAEIGASFNRRLLSFAQKRPLLTTTVDLNARIVDVLELLRRSLGERIKMSTELAPDAWHTVSDPGEIESVLVNLAINARDAMPDGGQLRISTENVSLRAGEMTGLDAQPGDYVVLSVHDTGTGMTADVRRRSIEPFFTTKAPGKGTGLGLSSVYAFCKHCGGCLSIASEQGRGTTIQLHLPRSQAENKPELDSTEVPRGDGEIVLVVEDNDQVRRASVGRLEALGYVALESANVADALRMIAEDPAIALLFSDIVLPGTLSGFDIVREARNIRPDLRALLTSGHYDAQRSAASDHGHVAVLAKPYNRQQMALAVQRALKTRG